MATSEPQNTQGERPAGITCPHYEAIPGEKRCRHYLSNGACSRPDELMCVEWLKANGHPVPAATPKPAVTVAESPIRRALRSSPLDLFGNPNPDYEPDEPAPSRSAVAVQPVKSGHRSTAAPSADAPDAIERELRGLTTEDIENFKALGVEVCLRTESSGEVWLVPEYTGADRKEITPEHVATLCHVLDVFPGARVASFEKSPTPEKETEA